jgi:hypothetical protein
MVTAPVAIRITFAKPRRLRIKIAAAVLTSYAVSTVAGFLWDLVFNALLSLP